MDDQNQQVTVSENTNIVAVEVAQDQEGGAAIESGLEGPREASNTGMNGVAEGVVIPSDNIDNNTVP